MVSTHFFYGGFRSGKTIAARRLASELRVAHGGAVTILGAETKPIGKAAFKAIASGVPFQLRELYGQPQTVQSLIVCMHTNAPSPISEDVSVSLVAKVHALKLLTTWHVEAALLVLHEMQTSPITIDRKLIHKIWLTQQLVLPPELCMHIARTVIRDSLAAGLTDQIHWGTQSQTRQWGEVVALLMNADIVSTDLPALPKHRRDYYGVLAGA